MVVLCHFNSSLSSNLLFSFFFREEVSIMDLLLVAGVISSLWLKGILDVKINWMIMKLLTVVGLFVILGWAASCRTGPKYSRLGSWNRSNYNSLWSGLCTNYVSFAKNMFMAGKANSDELWQADMIIIKGSTFTSRQSE